MSHNKFYQLVKFVRDEPEISEDKLQKYLDQGMWPDKSQEHIGFFQSKENAEEQKKKMEDGSETHESEFDEDRGWFIVIRERSFWD